MSVTLHHLRIVIAEGLVRLQLHIDRLADFLALQRLLDLRKDVVVAAVQVNERLAPFIHDLAMATCMFMN